MADDPKLNIRTWSGTSPTRVVIDLHAKIKKHSFIFDNTIKTICFTSEQHKKQNTDNIIHESINNEQETAKTICSVLHKYNIQSVIIEGGAKTLQSFINNSLWDEARVFKGTTTFNDGIKAPYLAKTTNTVSEITTDNLSIYYND